MIRQIVTGASTHVGGISRIRSFNNQQYVKRFACALAIQDNYHLSSYTISCSKHQTTSTFLAHLRSRSHSTAIKALNEIDTSSNLMLENNTIELLTNTTAPARYCETDFDSESPRMSLLMELTDRVGVLHDVLKYFWKYDVNICRIESRPSTGTVTNRRFDFFVDIEGSVDDDSGNTQKLLLALQESQFVDKLIVIDDKRNVNWFPRHVSEIDLIANRVLDAGSDLEADHPGFLDPTYRSRRGELAKFAFEHSMEKPIAHISYTSDEISVWTAVWDKMETLWDLYACTEYLQALHQMKTHCGYDRTNIPQQYDISKYLKEKTGFRMRPVAGLLSSRDFLNALAFRIFCSTQYIRHSSHPLYTPEPDIVHELLGHAPMLADPDFADFSQQIGLASLGAIDDEIAKLARCYWFSVEFGLCKEDGRVKGYGAGLLSSFGELEFACSSDHPTVGGGLNVPPTYKDWDPYAASRQEFPITTYQPLYFVADTLMDAKLKMRRYCEDLPRPFFAFHNEQNDTIHIDRPVQRTKGEVPNATV